MCVINLLYVTNGNVLVCIGATLSELVKTQFLVEYELRQMQALKLYTVRLMPAEEAVRSLWDTSTCISRGIKENMQRKNRWKDKCVGTLWRTQKWKPSPGNYIKFWFTLNLQWIHPSNFILCIQCHCGITVHYLWLSCCRWKSCGTAVFRKTTGYSLLHTLMSWAAALTT